MSEVCLVLAPRQNHFFVEVAEALEVELSRLGVPVEISRSGFPPLRDGLAYVLIPPHEFRGLAPPEHWPTRRQLERTLLYCFEQPGTKFFDADVEMGRGPVGAVLDVNPVAVAEHRRNGVHAHHAPLGWTPAWTLGDPTATPAPVRDVDLLHLGIYSSRRGAALARSAERLARWRAELVLGDDHAPNSVAQANFAIAERKWDLLARSRVLLNIHVGDRPYFEWLRVIQAICNGVLVASEESADPAPLRPGEHFLSGAPEQLVALAEPYLEDERLRAAAALDAYDFLKQELPFSGAAELIAELADRVSRGAWSDPGDGPVAWPDNAGIRAEIMAAADAAAPVEAAAAIDPAHDGELVLFLEPDVELLPHGLQRLTDALASDPAAAFAWGQVAAEDELRNVFPWQPWRLADGPYIEQPVLWRAGALRMLGVVTQHRELYPLAAERRMRGVHVPQIVARRTRRP